MTRDQRRNACIEAMCVAINKLYDDPMCSKPKDEDWIEEATAALDALPTAGAKVVIEEPEGTLAWIHPSNWVLLKKAVCLTNPPEGKP